MAMLAYFALSNRAEFDKSKLQVGAEIRVAPTFYEVGESLVKNDLPFLVISGLAPRFICADIGAFFRSIISPSGRDAKPEGGQSAAEADWQVSARRLTARLPCH